MLYNNQRKLTLIKTTNAEEQHLTLLGIDDFSIEEIDEVIQVLFNVNKMNLEQRKQLFSKLNPNSAFSIQ